MNALYEFSGDRRDVDVGMSDVERKVLKREETILDDDLPAAATLLTSGLRFKSLTQATLCVSARVCVRIPAMLTRVSVTEMACVCVCVCVCVCRCV